ncbi:MAG: hypothetical protein M3R02_13805 [Chloroflexota bacterium]|nr:hypothetical protein [Chloroflexota bacterium]
MFRLSDVVQEDRLLQLRDRLAQAAGARRLSPLGPPAGTVPPWAAAARATATTMAHIAALAHERLGSRYGKNGQMTACGLS